MQLLFVISSCKERNPVKRDFLTSRFNAGYITMKCNPLTNLYDCHESVPMLTFAIDHYGTTVARRFIFLHDHETSWHYNNSLYNQIEALQMTEYWKAQYGGLFAANYSTDYLSFFDTIFDYAFKNVSNMPPKQVIGNSSRPCCATFFVDSHLLWRRSRDEYISVRDNLREWNFNYRKDPNNIRANARCGRVTEHTWFALFAGANGTVPPPPI